MTHTEIYLDVCMQMCVCVQYCRFKSKFQEKSFENLNSTGNNHSKHRKNFSVNLPSKYVELELKPKLKNIEP